MLSEVSQIEKDKYCMISLICGILKIKLIGEASQKEKNKYRLLTHICGI